MIRTAMLAAVAALACSCSPQSPTSAPTATPAAAPPAAAAPASQDQVAMIRALYDPYLATNLSSPPPLESAPWTDELRALLQKAMTLSKDEVILDADPIVAAQDWQLSNLEVTQEKPPEAGRSIVMVKFRNLTVDQTLHYDLVEVDGVWRVDNIRTADWNLRDNLVTGIAEVEKSMAPK